MEKTEIRQAASAYRSADWWSGGRGPAEVVARLAAGSTSPTSAFRTGRGLDVAIAFVWENAAADRGIRECGEAMEAYDAYSHHDDASDPALCDVVARAIAAETEVLEAVVAANRRGDPDLWELESAASELGMLVRHDRTFGEVEIRRQGREIATVWRDRSNDEWLRATCDGT